MDNYRIGQTLTIEDGTQEGAVLKKSIILGKNAVKYALLHECLLTDSYYMQIKFGLIVTCISGCATFMYTSATKMKFRSGFRMLATIVPGCLVYGLVLLQFWCLYKRWKDAKVDEEVAEFGQDYVLGGLEYYSQMVRRNKALYYIMKDNTKDFFTSSGNEKERLLWNDRVPVTAKRDFFKEKMADLNET